MTDDLIRHIYTEYHRLKPWERQRSQWITDQATRGHLEGIVVPSPPDPDENEDHDKPRTGRAYLLGLPIEIREGTDGIQIEVAPLPFGPEAWDPDGDSEG